ncbi:B3 domain-containing transcription factor FUS3 [Hibiscus syriacus]|uniref:B3 domain-containing transcription factor FUS3 n=1 Tax=Hibiscus syriacus TaxID=106335 RepID=A0A6A3D330_HIBSY|nr:B3 domain-containing transcription factor FUS3 [Hibiscus syriacus]
MASSQVDTRRMIHSGISTHMRQNNTNKDLYNFITPDNKRLRVLLKKELKNSDVGSLGRIVLPKRETEANLPILYDKEGIQVTLKDVYTNNEWTLKYKYWINNKSRMYVLENTGDFVGQNGMRNGDSLTLYEDESMNLYFSLSKVATAAVEPSSYQNQYYNNLNNKVNNNNNNLNNNVNNSSHIYMASKDDEEASLELLIEQLKHKEPQEPNDLMMTLLMDAANNSNSQMQTPTTLPGSGSVSMNFDDFYGGLDMLPDVNHYNFSL